MSEDDRFSQFEIKELLEIIDRLRETDTKWRQLMLQLREEKRELQGKLDVAVDALEKLSSIDRFYLADSHTAFEALSKIRGEIVPQIGKPINNTPEPSTGKSLK